MSAIRLVWFWLSGLVVSGGVGVGVATVLTLDRFGEFRCGSRWKAVGNQMHLEKEITYPDSLGGNLRTLNGLLLKYFADIFK